MRRWLLGALLAIVALAVASQLAIPPLVANHLEGKLTDGGGSASVSVTAFPAARLLFGDGERITVNGSGLDLPLTEPNGDVLRSLDGFDRVAVDLRRFRAGPLAVGRFELTREAPSAPYHLVSRARTTPAALSHYGAERLGLPGGPLLGFFAGQAPGGTQPIPIALDLDVRSEGGRAVVVSGGGTVAGIPTGPLAELLTAVVAVRL